MKRLLHLLVFISVSSNAQSVFSGDILYKSAGGAGGDSLRLVTDGKNIRITFSKKSSDMHCLMLCGDSNIYTIDVNDKHIQKVKASVNDIVKLVPVADDKLQDTVILGYKCHPKKYEIHMPRDTKEDSSFRAYLVNWYATDIKLGCSNPFQGGLLPVEDTLVSFMQQAIMISPQSQQTYTSYVALHINLFSPSGALFKLPADYKLIDLNTIKVEDVYLEKVESVEEVEPPPPPPPPKKKKKKD